MRSSGGAYKAYGLAVLVLLYIFSMIDRSIISMLIGPVRQDLELDDFQASLVMGPAFGVAYVIAALPFGWAADRFRRSRVIAFGIVCWSLGCASGGFATGFASLFLSRMIVGAGEAAMSPCAYSLMAGWFSRRHLPVAMGLYHFGGSLGASIALMAGGAIAQWTSAANANGLLGSFHPWQIGFLLVGLPGLPLGLLALALREPRTAVGPMAAPSRSAILRGPPLWPFVKRHALLIVCQFAAFGLALLVVYGASYWTPQLLIRVLAWPPARVGNALAALNLAGVLAGQVGAVGLIAWLNRRGHHDAALRAFGFALAIGLAGSLIAFTASSWLPLAAGLFLLNAGLTPVMTYGSSALQLFVPAPLRGRMSALFLSFTSLAGLGLGPTLVGFLSEYAFSGAGLRPALLAVSSLALVAAFLLLLVALAPYRRSVLQWEAEDAAETGGGAFPAAASHAARAGERVQPAM